MCGDLGEENDQKFNDYYTRNAYDMVPKNSIIFNGKFSEILRFINSLTLHQAALDSS